MRICFLLCPVALLLMIAATYGESATNIAVTNSSSTVPPKTSDKLSYPKKVTSLKKRPTKSASTTVAATVSSTTAKPKKPLLAAAFKNLPADDLEFIAELDKQFNLHGDKIKIKVERENITDSKNAKRTIEGELGYGYAHNGYEYPKPKFMFYPYSQRDIPSSAPGYYPSHEQTGITIEPSYSYELEPQKYVQHEQPQIDLPAAEAPTYHGHHPQQAQQHEPQQQEYEDPVIVLRIPGPAKYASHLQTLLQQYLEIRAAQYLRILEGAEQRQQHNEQQHQHQHQQHQSQIDYHYSEQTHAAPEQQQEYVPQYEQAAPQHEEYQQQVVYAHQQAPTPQPISYPAIDDVYQGYKGRHQQQEEHAHYAQQPQYYQPEEYAHAQAAAAPHAPVEVPQYYYMHEHQFDHAPATHNSHSYQHVYLVAMAAPESQPIYEDQGEPQHEQEPQPIYVHEQQEHAHEHVQAQAQAQEQEQEQEHAHEQHLQTTENNPRQTHTKVIFTHNSEQGAHDYSNMYVLPSIRPYERHAPTSTPTYQHYPQQHAEESAPAADAAGGEQQSSGPATAKQHEVAITQRPFNYHAHSSRARRTRGNIKRNAGRALNSDQQFKRIQDVVANKLGAKKGASTEYKTKEVIEG